MDSAPEADDVAQAMGFSSFGGPSKKRSHDDASSPPPLASAPPASLPRRPPAPAHSSSSSSSKGKDPNGYKRYYDPTSIENPWLALETALGLESNGTWPTSHQNNSH
ncbi:hypothetical protein L249_6169 [Ophiocordyceps polyrhachis-furcata BCC 54312]|uniref:Uncharacterized protein n=1 Tax=Ophiocordyceps polyrhachis-furcata BCC 54312 TaxID=1330021 RepID=A0A367LJ39_9HYPO|nr:hypothetical protein L249_6169 [Ophiocordyceps polyrhachis-furcata BCC 54312]